MSDLRQLIRDNRGATAIEYAILIGMIALVVYAGITKFGGALNSAINGQAGAVGGVNTTLGGGGH
jgi:pilus assembly protein Flp/PilA